MTRDRWWKTGVIYQIAVSSFADADGDGRGDLRGIISRLDHLAGAPGSLGVDAIWLTPITASPLRDFGYDVADYRAIDPRFGTMADFEELLAECHRRGLRVMMDLVLNHTSDEHPWFAESRASRESPHRDWYVWRDGREAGRPPNRWRAVVEGSAWEHDPRTGQYYYHAFLPFQPDLNWRNPAVREEMLDVARFWLGLGVDGFRLDLINFLYEDEQLRDNPRRLGWRPYLSQRHVHDFSQPESLDAACSLRRVADEFGDRALMGEVFSDSPADCVAYLGDGSDRLNLAFYVDFIGRPWRAEAFRQSVRWLEANLPTGAWPCYYLSNHDVRRAYTRLGGRHAEARARVAAALLLTLRGTPILYYGEEIGMPEGRVPRSQMDDPVGRRFWPFRVGRDGARTPMQWSGGPGAGFTHGRPWLPIDPSHGARNVEAQRVEPGSMLAWYRRLLALRRATPALHSGAYRELPGMPRGVLGYERTAPAGASAGPGRIGVLLNFTAHPRRFTMPASGTCLASTHTFEGAHLAGTLALAPHEALIVEFEV